MGTATQNTKDTETRRELLRRKRIHGRLLSGTNPLKAHNFSDMTQEDRLLRVALMAYLKHSALEGRDDIGWEELTDALQNEICNTIGDPAFCAWLDRMRGPEVEP
jgi:hypothetical protein